MQHKEPKEEVTSNFFTANELYAMHRAWKEVTRGRPCDAECPEIVDALASLVEGVMRPDPMPPGSYLVNMAYFRAYHAEKLLLTENLLRDWDRITEGQEFAGWGSSEVEDPLSQDEDIEMDDLRRVRDNWVIILHLYDKLQEFLLEPGCQLLMYILLICWYITLEIVGIIYLDCTKSYSLAYLFMALGAIGCFAVLVRLTMKYYTRGDEYPQEWSRERIGLKVLEVCFVVVYIVQVCIYFATSPSSKTIPKQCEDFFAVAQWTNYMSMFPVAVYLLMQIFKCVNKFYKYARNRRWGMNADTADLSETLCN